VIVFFKLYIHIITTFRCQICQYQRK